MKWLATWMMNRIAGDGSSEWALAMRREFDELEQGQLGWAVGCASTELRRIVTANLGLAMLLLAIHFLGPVFGGVLTSILTSAGLAILNYAVALGFAAPFAFMLGAYRPDARLAITVIGGLFLPLVSGFTFAQVIVGQSFMDYILGVGATFLVYPNAFGTISMFAIWFFSASAGAYFANWRTSDPYSASSP